MKHESLAEAGLTYAPCRYGISRTFFRGPRKALDDPHISVLGGTGTYGKFVEYPYATILESELGRACVNFGVMNGGIDVFLNDPVVLSACQSAEATVVQVLGAQNLSNRFYRVHPRRNDRFVAASTVLRALYNDVDFSEFNFTRHMLGALFTRSAEKFEIVREELQQAWMARMKLLIEKIGSPVVLLWFSNAKPDDAGWTGRARGLGADPLFVTGAMIEALRPLVHETVIVRPSVAARSAGTEGMIYPMLQADAATEMMGVIAHEEAAGALTRPLRALLTK